MTTAAGPTVLHIAAVEYSVRTLLLPQLAALARAGCTVRVACAPEGEAFHADLAPYRPVPLTFSRSLRPVPITGALVRLAALVRRERPAAVHLHSPAAALPVRLLPRGLLPAGTRVLYTVHGFSHQWDEPMPARDRRLERLERMLAGRTDAILFQSAEDFTQAGARGYRSRLRLIGNGVEDHWFSVPAPDPVREPLRLLFVGRIVREKGVLELLEALARVPGVELGVAGTEIPSERTGVLAEARREVSRLGLDGRVRFLGHVDADRMPAVVADHHALVLPSHREGMPRSLIEGLAAGRPCVATDIRGCRELVDDGVNGYLVPRSDPAALAGAIRRLAELPADDFVRLSTAARVGAESSNRESAVFERVVAVYREVGILP
ncbi:MAG: hypothetical protein QOG43_3323 [Actinomycetota bacterium]|nr:hypothetical protein [Actinomycetota bacterium]